MLYIVFDLETVVVRNGNMTGHIVEIGATKVIEIGGEVSIAGSFQVYVKPPKEQWINKDTLKFIGAKREYFKDAPHLSEAVDMFKEWIGLEEYCLCTWSTSEVLILKNNWEAGGFDTSWIVNVNDIQPLICQTIDTQNHQIGLKRASSAILGSQGDEGFHSALYDSHCTALMLKKCFNDIKDNIRTNRTTFEDHAKAIEESKERKREASIIKKMGNGIFSSLTRKQREELLKNLYLENK